MAAPLLVALGGVPDTASACAIHETHLQQKITPSLKERIKSREPGLFVAKIEVTNAVYENADYHAEGRILRVIHGKYRGKFIAVKTDRINMIWCIHLPNAGDTGIIAGTIVSTTPDLVEIKIR